MKKFKNNLLFLLGITLFLGACTLQGNSSESIQTNKDSNRIQVVTTIFPVYEITKAIAGDIAEVSLMVGASDDAHHFEPSAQAITSVNEAHIFIYSSDLMEFWVESLLEVIENDDLKIIDLSSGLDLSLPNDEIIHSTDHDHSHDHGGQDPHFWLDPLAVEQQTSIITDTLSEVDPQNASLYEENAGIFSTELLTLHESYEEAFSEAESREFVVQHQAFGHLANRYNLEQVAVGGLQTEIEPSPKKLVEIIELIQDQEVPVIYYQSGESSGIAETIASETGTDVAVLYDLEQKPAAFANANETDNLYLKAMYHNLNELKKSAY